MVILLVVGLVNIVRYSKFVLLCCCKVVEIFVICINEKIFFCIWVLLDVVKIIIGKCFFVVCLNKCVIFLLIIVFILFMIKLVFMILIVIVCFLIVVFFVKIVLFSLVFFCIFLIFLR